MLLGRIASHGLSGKEPSIILLTFYGVSILISIIAYLLLGSASVRAVIYTLGLTTSVCCLLFFVLLTWSNFTATSIFSLAASFFVGLGAVYSANDYGVALSSLLWTAFFFSLGTFSAIAMSLFSSRSAERETTSPRETVDRPSQIRKHQEVRKLLLVGLLGFSFSAMAFVFLKPDWEPRLVQDSGSFSPLWYGLFIVSLLLLVYYITCRSKRALVQVSVCALLVFVYYFIAFRGFGRIQLVTLVIATATVAFFNMRSVNCARYAAAGALVSAVPILWLGSYIGQTRGFGAREVNVSLEHVLSGGGLESALLLLPDFTKLLGDGPGVPASAVQLAGGSTYWASAIWFVPRGFWPDKPINFGSELAFVLVPEYAIWGHTLAVTVFGEFFYNFGWLGVVFGSALAGWLLSRVDNLEVHVRKQRQGTTAHAFFAIGYALLVSGMVNLVWGGSGTFANREGTSLLVHGFIFGGLVLTQRRRRPMMKRGL